MYKKFIVKLLLILSVCLQSLYTFSPKIYAIDYLNDQFNSQTINPLWSVYNESYSNILSGNSLLVSNVEQNKSLYLINANEFINSSSIVYEIKFRYTGFAYGTGIALNDTQPITRVLHDDPGLEDWTVVLWPTDTNSLSLFSIPCSEMGPCSPQYNLLFNLTGAEALSWHTLRIEYSSGKYKIKLDNYQIVTTNAFSREPKYIWIGNPMTTGGTLFSSFEVDYVKVSSIDPPSSTFPYFSQLDPKWKDEVYDSADKWAGLGKNGIGRWGCALTSAAMVLQKNGVKALDGSDLDPSKLNTWLKSQPDGYLGLGYLNWLALTRYARLSHEAGHSPTKLEFTRSGTPTFPSIIGLPGHFVVVHGEDGSNWLVNDPANKTITTLPKSTALSSVNTFMPSMTDLSYMLFSSTPAITTSMIKEHGKNLNIDWKNEQVSDVVDNSAGPTNRIGLVSKPETGEYELKVSNTSDKPANFDIYLYDKFGNPFVKKLLIGKHSSIKFEIKYNKDKLGKIKIENVKKYRYEWNSKKRWYEKIWDEHDRWEERKSD